MKTTERGAFLDPKSLQATDATRTRMVAAFDYLIGARLGHTIDTYYMENFTEMEFLALNERLDELLRKRSARR